MNYRVLHRTIYRYSEAVPVSLNQYCLRPRDAGRQRCVSHKVSVEPEATSRCEWVDYFGNTQVIFSVGHAHREMRVTAESRVEVDLPDWPAPSATIPWEQALLPGYRPFDEETFGALQFRHDSLRIAAGDPFRTYAAVDFPAGRPVLEALACFTARMKKEFIYDSRATTLSTRAEQVLRSRRGVCQDFAQVQIACLRSLGFAARYVSGYLLTQPPPGQARLVGADASHCWASVFAPGLGWIDLDPTNGCVVGDEHVTVAWGRDYQDVTPVKGVILGGGSQTIHVAVDVEPVGR